MILQDDRTEEQKQTHSWIVLGTDPWMSDWAVCEGGPSYAGWACTGSDLPRCKWWVRSRGDMKRVRIVSGDYRPPSGKGHCHIYVFDRK